MSLFTINSKLNEAIELQMQGINEVVDTETGEVQDIVEIIEQLQFDKEEKIKNCVHLCKNLSSDITGWKSEIEKMKKLIKQAENIKSRVETILLDNADGTKIGQGSYIATIRKSESVIAPEDEEAVKKLPAEYVSYKNVETWKPNKAAIKKAIKAGAVVEGCSLQINRNISY